MPTDDTVTATRTDIENALRRLMATDVDYDLHKAFECGEDDGEDSYPDLTATFISYLDAAAAE